VFTQPARNRTNVRIQQKIPLPHRVAIDVMAEAFNVFQPPELDDHDTGAQPAVSQADGRRESYDAVRVQDHILRGRAF